MSRTGGVVKFLPPLQAEKLAYALARYSRSADPVEKSLEWVDGHSEERFWETFYFDYGHASIADLGHVAVCLEGISEWAAIEALDEQLWDGQARSTRYQDFSTAGWIVPPELSGHALEDAYRSAIARLIESYLEVHALSIAWLRERHPRPASMKEKPYERNVAARAFDMARYLLPLAIPTNVGQVTSIRTLERQISRLLASPLGEVRALAEQMRRAVTSLPHPRSRVTHAARTSRSSGGPSRPRRPPSASPRRSRRTAPGRPSALASSRRSSS
jgi:thymidylate synthase ThyX